MAFIIRKADGSTEEFSIKKFRRSLTKSGASPDVMNIKLLKKFLNVNQKARTKYILLHLNF